MYEDALALPELSEAVPLAASMLVVIIMPPK
jgi:hypothetical protein